MTQTSLDQLGPVDSVVVGFPVGQSNFSGELAEEDVVNLAAAMEPGSTVHRRRRRV